MRSLTIFPSSKTSASNHTTPPPQTHPSATLTGKLAQDVVPVAVSLAVGDGALEIDLAIQHARVVLAVNLLRANRAALVLALELRVAEVAPGRKKEG